MHGNPALPTEPVTRRRAGRRENSYQPGRESSPDWSAATDTPLGNLSFAPIASLPRPTPDSNPVESTAAFYGEDPALDVRSGDRIVRLNGEVYDVLGKPEVWSRAAGWPAGIVINVRALEQEPA